MDGVARSLNERRRPIRTLNYLDDIFSHRDHYDDTTY